MINISNYGEKKIIKGNESKATICKKKLLRLNKVQYKSFEVTLPILISYISKLQHILNMSDMDYGYLR